MYLPQVGNHGLNPEIQALEVMYSQVAAAYNPRGLFVESRVVPDSRRELMPKSE